MSATGPSTGAVPLGRSRSRVLEELQTAREPVGVAALAERLGLHQNTARFHLDALVAAGLAERQADTQHRPGRPRSLYVATPDSPSVGQRSYKLLAEILAGHLAAHCAEPEETAVRAGREWGRAMAEKPPPFHRVNAAQAVEKVAGTLTDIGFRLRAVVGGDRPRLELDHCPFRELALTQGDVVCSVHLGVVQGMFEQMDAPLQATRADAFVEPTLCVVDLAARRRHR